MRIWREPPLGTHALLHNWDPCSTGRALGPTRVHDRSCTWSNAADTACSTGRARGRERVKRRHLVALPRMSFARAIQSLRLDRVLGHTSCKPWRPP
ncbi:hypothetical protein Y032_0272g937 [Ancylostoma ceylanicum]|uniref:Uncharacterized protein n=1 Tax=Ancylostoma ceylanicum TaxID=53326 RepID=A0A016S9B0_9BILA|nr:hypothetical protein Y032_0272g937 [Ancylostoma ceylanicum]